MYSRNNSCDGVHNPDTNTTIIIAYAEEHSSDGRDAFSVYYAKNNHIKWCDFVIIHEDGVYDGYETAGDELTEDEAQTILDCFEGSYEGEA